MKRFFKKAFHSKSKNSSPFNEYENFPTNEENQSGIQIEWNTPLPPELKIDDRISNTFSDGRRRIDYVLVYEADSEENDLDRLDKEDEYELEEKKKSNILTAAAGEAISTVLTNKEREARRKREADKHRLRYLKHLKQAGLDIELDIDKSGKKIVKFIKLHIPWNLLMTYAEELNFQVPISIKQSDGLSYADKLKKRLKLDKLFSPYSNDEEIPIQYYTCLFRKSKVNKYIPSSLYPAYISNTQRQCALFEILQSTRYGRIERGEIGINRLIQEGIFTAAFPLHDAHQQRVLSSRWARFSAWYKPQPLELVRDYFGEKIGFYFAWLGAYTAWLLLPSLVGLVVFFVNLMLSFNDPTVNEVCSIGHNITMCPLCNQCPYWNLSDICFQAQTGVLFDNSATLFYAVFMSFWASCFLEYWKRKNITLAYEWNCLGYEQEDERPRSEFVIKADIIQRNPVTGKEEPGFSKSKRRIRMLAGFTTIIFMILIVIIFMFAVIMYKTFINISIFKEYSFLKPYASNISSLSGAVLNLMLILAMGRIYEKIAYVLTEWEMHETQTDFENHLTFKVFIFEFVNFYSSIFYIAFVKGKFVGYPGNYTYFLGLRNEDCENGGCLFELSQQFAIIMIGKQMINNIQEFLLPKIKGLFQKLMIRFSKKSTEKNQQEKDFELPNHDGLFDEYLEMVLQFGFITSFVAAFPLGPLFALLNNWIEIRLDAQKLVNDTRRPVAQRASNIGIWSEIIESLVTIAVICNGFLIAFTSEFLPKLLYKSKNNWSLDGYTQFSLAYSPQGAYDETCRYRAFRDNEGQFTDFYWQLLVFRLCFVIIFEHVVFSVCKLIEFLIPDIPENLAIKIKRERYLAKKALQDAI